jgi:hypothetical protein
VVAENLAIERLGNSLCSYVHPAAAAKLPIKTAILYLVSATDISVNDIAGRFDGSP